MKIETMNCKIKINEMQIKVNSVAKSEYKAAAHIEIKCHGTMRTNAKIFHDVVNNYDGDFSSYASAPILLMNLNVYDSIKMLRMCFLDLMTLLP